MGCFGASELHQQSRQAGQQQGGQLEMLRATSTAGCSHLSKVLSVSIYVFPALHVTKQHDEFVDHAREEPGLDGTLDGERLLPVAEPWRFPWLLVMGYPLFWSFFDIGTTSAEGRAPSRSNVIRPSR